MTLRQNSIILSSLQHFFGLFGELWIKLAYFHAIFPLFGAIWAQLSCSTQKTESLHVVAHEYESVSDFATCKSYTTYYIASKVFARSEYVFCGAPAFGDCFIPLFLSFCQLFLSLNATLNNAWFYAFFFSLHDSGTLRFL